MNTLPNEMALFELSSKNGGFVSNQQGSVLFISLVLFLLCACVCVCVMCVCLCVRVYAWVLPDVAQGLKR